MLVLKRRKKVNGITPWILFPVTGHLGPLALFFVVWYTNFPPTFESIQHIPMVYIVAIKKITLGFTNSGDEYASVEFYANP